MDFETGLLVSTDSKAKNYDSILIIIDRVTKMVYYKPIKSTIDAQGLTKVIIDIVVWHYD